jgi:hypothetical protein
MSLFEAPRARQRKMQALIPQLTVIKRECPLIRIALLGRHWPSSEIAAAFRAGEIDTGELPRADSCLLIVQCDVSCGSPLQARE